MTNPRLLAGLGRIAYDLGAIIDSPAQAAARRTEQAHRRPCPTCKSGPGVRCRTASGKLSRQPHSARFDN